MTMNAEIEAKRAREITDTVDKCWKAMVDLTIEEKALALDRLTKLVAMEEATHHAQQ
jgi:hypothetical protein